MASSGIRIGAWDYLRWRDITTITRDENVIAGKIRIYSGDPEQYYSFITAEAFDSLNEWMKYRESYGKKITGESWLMRDIWQTSERTYGAFINNN